ncbi:hypothetical protein CHS0354_023879 [Potamilus streckersoni]|uniref:dihydroxy-acid dehydratase n=1 Tax=Potamilus streckersoni TaxID=2493646 RepID=A0AAE0RZ08_9BIVA|nr:hypothetical protein CHS0354_023879 [Potamilus streckersoni]
MELNKYSKELTQNDELPAAQAMLHAIGLNREDLKKPQIGIASTGYDGNPCNSHLNDLAKFIKQSILDEKLIGLIFNTIGISDGISMGTPGMRYSLPSREIIADSIESVVSAMAYDGLVAVVGCDKNMPGAMIAISRLNRPSIIVYGGTIASGKYKDRILNIVSAFEALGEKYAGTLSEEDFRGIIENACPGAGACGGMYTANTMSSAIEALGMSLPHSASNPAISIEKQKECLSIGRAIKNVLEKDIKPKDILTFEAFHNAIVVITILGGSTNAVLHLLAMAKAGDVKLTLNDFHNICKKTPLLADLKPSGKFMMEDIHNIGGLPAVMKLLLDNKLLFGECLTITGKTIAENLASVNPMPQDQRVIMPLSNPINPNGHIRILYGNLAEQGAVAKITGKEGSKFEGIAKVFDGEFEANEGLRNDKVKKGDVIVIRYEGPKGGPGMPEMLKPTSLVTGLGLGNDVALITDGRFSGGTHGFVVGHITPEAQAGGTLALVKDGDKIIIDSDKNLIQLVVPEEELILRRQNLATRPYRINSGYLYKYARQVSTASEGCVTDDLDS